MSVKEQTVTKVEVAGETFTLDKPTNQEGVMELLRELNLGDQIEGATASVQDDVMVFSYPQGDKG
ncbi:MULTISPECIES: hypothetical protein [Bacillus]|nr:MULTISPECIES: hypothetical protein [Bacillus]MCY8636527.1 hypothetical protein [Bacillus sp. S17B2]KTF59720.1 hypothetical protein AR691_13385 [Bacillus amyloliquefaciens]MBT3123293.1 hypothetical protein [Bacillus inaquosorum]MCB4338875.1 hypothetical protein [Bacillus subtilis]MCB5337240.1 hypothetical protein [Bacillus amyloliquefaciens]